LTHNTYITPTKVQKDAKLGDIPMDWKVVSFGDISDKKTKWNITGGPFGSDLKSEHYTDSGVRVIQLQNIGDGTFNQEYKIYTSEEKADQLIACNIFPGEIILSKMGDPVARACFIPNGENRYLMGSDGIRLVVNKEKFDSKFVLEYINYSIFRNLAIRHSTGSTRSRIGLTDLRKLPFICPPLSEQKKIAQILSVWDKAIVKQGALLVHKQKVKKGLKQQLLTGKKRLKGFKGKWLNTKLGSLTTIKAGGTPSKAIPEYWDGNIRWMNSGELNLKKVSEVEGRINELGLKNSSTNLLPKFCVLIGLAGQGKTRGTAAINLVELCTNQSVAAVLPSENFDSFFMYFLIDSKYELLRQLSAGDGGRGGLNLKILNGLKVSIPEIKEQQRIAEVLTAADDEITTLKQQLQQLNTQKQGLMQQLLTGKIRVKV